MTSARGRGRGRGQGLHCGVWGRGPEAGHAGWVGSLTDSRGLRLQGLSLVTQHPSWVARQGAAALGVRAPQRRWEAGAAQVALRLKGARGHLARVSRAHASQHQSTERRRGGRSGSGLAACGCGGRRAGPRGPAQARKGRALVCPSPSGDVRRICSHLVSTRLPGSGGTVEAR